MSIFMTVGTLVGSVQSFDTLAFLDDWVISTLFLSPLINLLVELSSSSGPFVDLDSAGWSLDRLSLDVCRSASLVWWTGLSTTSVSVSKETFSPIIFY